MDKQMIESKDYYMRARALFRAEKYSEAEKYFNRAIEKNSMNIDAYMGLAYMYIDMKEYAKAKDNLKKVLVIDNKNGEVYFHLGNIAYLSKDIVSARSNYSKAISYGCDNPVALYYMAMSNLATKDVINAKFYLNQILQKDSRNPKARMKLIEISNSEGNYDEMLIQSEQLILHRPDAFEGYHYKFLALLNLDKDDEALNTLMHAIELFPGDLGFAYDLILFYIKKEEYEVALKYIEKRFEKDSRGKKLILPQKAKILFKMKRFDEAKASFEQIGEKRIDEECKFLLMIIMVSEQNFEKAVKLCREIIENSKSKLGKYYFAALYFKGICLKEMNDIEYAKISIDEANDQLRLQSTKEPGNITLFLYRILCEVYLENYEVALELADYAMTLTDGRNGEIYLARGLVYNRMGDNKKSKDDLEKAKQYSDALGDLFKEVLV